MLKVNPCLINSDSSLEVPKKVFEMTKKWYLPMNKLGGLAKSWVDIHPHPWMIQ